MWLNIPGARARQEPKRRISLPSTEERLHLRALPAPTSQLSPGARSWEPGVSRPSLGAKLLLRKPYAFRSGLPPACWTTSPYTEGHVCPQRGCEGPQGHRVSREPGQGPRTGSPRPLHARIPHELPVTRPAGLGAGARQARSSVPSSPPPSPTSSAPRLASPVQHNETAERRTDGERSQNPAPRPAPDLSGPQSHGNKT